MACNCFDEVLNEIKTKVVSDILPADASKESLELNWKNQVIRSDGRANNVMLPLECSYQRTKQSGEEYRNRTKHPLSMGMRFCPFCGTEF